MPLLVEITQLRALLALAVVLWIVDALLRRRDMRRRREAALPLAAIGGSIALAARGVPFAQ